MRWSRCSPEEWPVGYRDQLAREGVSVRAVEMSDRWIDIGTTESLASLGRLDERGELSLRPG